MSSVKARINAEVSCAGATCHLTPEGSGSTHLCGDRKLVVATGFVLRLPCFVYG